LRERWTDFSAARLLARLDDVQAEHLPADLAALQRVERGREGGPTELGRALALVEELQRVLGAGTFPANAVAALEMVFAGRRFNLERDEDAALADAAEAWREVLGECVVAAEKFGDIATDDWWTLALRMYGERRRTTDKAAGALDLLGWLELLWEDAPHLIVAGCNDGLVPDAIVGDAFLPDGLRERLGLKTNGARFARDAYILQALAETRARAGRLDVLLARVSSIGEPLRPSRLLLRCEDEELPGRIDFLFREVEAARRNLAWTRAWKLVPRRAAAPERVSVTGLRTWLACPFRFYLTHVLRMEAVEPAKSEMDARDFGTLCHGALEAMAREPALRDCTDEKTLRDFLLARFDAAARERFGDRLTLPLVMQLESGRQRLSRAAAVQARDRGEGWVIEQAEWSFVLDFDGLTVKGKIDRCDRHEASGAWRVLDYKTTDSGPAPHKTHLRPLRSGDDRLPEWMRVEVGGRPQVWADLQLPLYVAALARARPEVRDLRAGYFNLPKAVAQTAIVGWDELTPELQASAAACAAGVTAAIKAGEFWPPAELAPERDAFATLFHHGAEESVAWEARG
jgi:ATP-dependent helicase/nuclease subunit B